MPEPTHDANMMPIPGTVEVPEEPKSNPSRRRSSVGESEKPGNKSDHKGD